MFDLGAANHRADPILATLAFCLVACDSHPYKEIAIAPQVAPAPVMPTQPAKPHEQLRISVAAMQSPQETYGTYSRLFSILEKSLGRKIEFVQRRSYGEVNGLLLDGNLDAALLCSGGYAALLKSQLVPPEVLAVPVVEGKSTYRSFVIVPAQSPYRSLSDLKGRRFAFTDLLSLSGRAYVVDRLQRDGFGNTTFFGATFFTHSHDRSIQAVATGLADGASVDSLIYERIAARNSKISAAIRVIERSPEFGLMPFVAAPHLAEGDRHRLRDALHRLHENREAQPLLLEIGIQRFAAPSAGLFDSAIDLVGRLN